jgi:hypothetical protein
MAMIPFFGQTYFISPGHREEYDIALKACARRIAEVKARK